MATLAVPESPAESPRQNWILSSWGDYFFIIGTPVFVLPVILWLFFTGGELLVWSAFAVVNTSHHLPTFLRIYGDRDLLKRFRWSLLLAPIIPFGCCLLAVTFLIRSGSSMNDILYLYVIVTIWDLWHFLMQHYGFMRIYDRHNRAPRKIAARMDLWLCGSWFAYIMLKTVAWLPNLLYQLAIDCGVPLLNFVNSSFLMGCQWIAWIVALLATVCYVVYLCWCRQKRYFISHAKLALMLVTFGMMYLTYVPHGAMDQLIVWITNTFDTLASGLSAGQGSDGTYARGFHPSGAEWTLLSGFATLGIVHVTQYLAIVWKYNRNLAQREQAVRAGIFQKFFSRGGGPVISIYVLLCLVYGYVVTMGPGNPVQPNIHYDWLAGLLVSVLFASTITHYYYDGFIWKVRHKENRQNLEMEEAVEQETGKTVSWWGRSRTLSPLKAMSWHAVYFLPPILFLSGCYWMTQQRSVRYPVRQIKVAITKARGASTTTYQVTKEQKSRAEAIISNIDQQLTVEDRMIDLFPMKRHYTYKADLIYWRSVAQMTLLQQGLNDPQALRQHHEQVILAINAYRKSLTESVPGTFSIPGTFSNREETELDEQEVRRRIALLHQETFQLNSRIEALQRENVIRSATPGG